jgi:hypothetical protein
MLFKLMSDGGEGGWETKLTKTTTTTTLIEVMKEKKIN